MIGATLGHYEIAKKLGAGGMGEVYLATDQRLGRQVALKILPERFAVDQRIERFRREARVLAALDHPGIVTVYSIDSGVVVGPPAAGGGPVDLSEGLPPEIHFLTMQYVQGKPLSVYLPRHGLSLDTFLHLAIPLTDAVSAAHEEGIIHRDLKPSNIMVADEGRIKVLDFGLAKLLTGPLGTAPEDETPEMLTGSSERLGTLPYMSPEQIRGQEADHRSDIFSLAVVLYLMATGEYPFQRGSSADLASSILRDTPSSVKEIRAELPRQLDWILHLCLQKEPDRRLQSMKDLHNEIEYLEEEVTSSQAVPTEQLGIKRRSRLLTWLLSATVGLVVLLGGLLILREKPPPVLESGPPLYLTIEPVRRLAGDLDPFFPAGMVRWLEHRLQGMEGFYIVGTGYGSPVPHYRLEIDSRREGEQINLWYRLVEQASERPLSGAEILRTDREQIVELSDQLGEKLEDLLLSNGVVGARYRARGPPSRHGAALKSFLSGLELFRIGETEGDLNAAQRAFVSARSLDPTFQLARVYEGLVLLQQSRKQADPRLLTRSAALCLEASQAQPDLALAHLCLAEKLRLEGRLSDAADAYLLAIEHGLRHPAAYDGARETFEGLGRPAEETEEFWNRVVELDPRYWRGYKLRFEFYLEKKLLQEALEDAKRAQELAPASPGGYLGLFKAQYDLGYWDDAFTTVQRGLERYPDDYKLWAGRGLVRYQLSQFDDAITAFTRSLELEPNDHRAHGYLGRVYYWAPGGRPEALPHLQRAIELAEQLILTDPPGTDARLLLAWYQAMAGDSEASRQNLAAVLEYQPNDPHFLHVAGLIQVVLGDEAAALDSLERSASGGKRHPELLTCIDLEGLRDDPRFEALLKPRN